MATVNAGHRRGRPLEKAAAFFVLLALPLSQRPFSRWAIRTLVPMRSRFRVVQVCDATPHRCGVRRCRQLHAVGRRLRACTASLPRGVCCASSAARRPMQSPVVRCNRRRSSAWHPIV
jgi:hypothetical protein